MNKADKIFEELGYRKDENEYMVTKYDYMGEKEKFKNGKEKSSYIYGTDKRIEFYLDDKVILTYSPTLRDDYEDCSIIITIQELQAINEKCKELGWIE